MSVRRQLLKTHTQAIHDALHAQRPFCDIARGCFTASDVATLIDLHTRCWAQYLPRGEEDPFVDLFGLSAQTLFDLPSTRFRPRPRPARTDTALTRGAALGAAYVYLGSKFGGAILGRQLIRHGYHAAAARMQMRPVEKTAWTTLWTQVDRLDADAFDQCLTEAEAAFAAFQCEAVGA